MIKLTNTLKAWETPEFEQTLKDEIQSLDAKLLPLQQGLSQSSYVSEGDFKVMVLNVADSANTIRVKTGIFYSGVIAGSCCSDDPTPNCEQNEYCELQFNINKVTAESTVDLVES